MNKLKILRDTRKKLWGEYVKGNTKLIVESLKNDTPVKITKELNDLYKQCEEVTMLIRYELLKLKSDEIMTDIAEYKARVQYREYNPCGQDKWIVKYS